MLFGKFDISVQRITLLQMRQKTSSLCSTNFHAQMCTELYEITHAKYQIYVKLIIKEQNKKKQRDRVSTYKMNNLYTQTKLIYIFISFYLCT